MRATYAMADGVCRPPGGEFTAEELRHALRCLADAELAIELVAGGVVRFTITAAGTIDLVLADASAAPTEATIVNMPMAEAALEAAIAGTSIRAALAPFFFLQWRRVRLDRTVDAR